MPQVSLVVQVLNQCMHKPQQAYGIYSFSIQAQPGWSQNSVGAGPGKISANINRPMKEAHLKLI